MDCVRSGRQPRSISFEPVFTWTQFIKDTRKILERYWFFPVFFHSTHHPFSPPTHFDARATTEQKRNTIPTNNKKKQKNKRTTESKYETCALQLGFTEFYRVLIRYCSVWLSGSYGLVMAVTGFLPGFSWFFFVFFNVFFSSKKSKKVLYIQYVLNIQYILNIQ